jgi:hypothetical protein
MTCKPYMIVKCVLLFFNGRDLNSGLCTSWAISLLLEPGLQPPVLWLFLRWGGLTFCLVWPELQLTYFMLPVVDGMTGMHHLVQSFLLRWDPVNLFCPSCPIPVIFLIPAFCVADMTGTCHHIQLSVQMRSHKHFLLR